MVRVATALNDRNTIIWSHIGDVSNQILGTLALHTFNSYKKATEVYTFINNFFVNSNL